MQKIVIFGGGSGLSQLLKGIVQFPWEVTAVVSVSDNGGSTGDLRKEMDIPAVGDITKVMMAMSGSSQGVKDLFMYRFAKDGSLHGHSIKNLIMTALLEMHGSFRESIPILSDLLDLKGDLLPVTEDNVNLVGITENGLEIDGEAEITDARSRIRELHYDKPVRANPEVIRAVREADLIVFSSGSLLTSISPHIIIPEIQQAVKESRARTLYVCNMLTQPGETDDYTVSRHIDRLEQYLGAGAIDAVIANDEELPHDIGLFAQSEGKDPVPIDRDVLAARGITLIEDKLAVIEDGYLRHDSLKTAYLMFAYLMSRK